MIVHTESGAAYQFTKDGGKFRRLRKRNEVDPEAPERAVHRKDGHWLTLFEPVEPVVGQPMTLLVEPVEPPLVEGMPAGLTVRMSTVVIGIED